FGRATALRAPHPPNTADGRANRFRLLDVQQVDDENEGLAGQEVTGARGAVRHLRRADALAAAADLHARDALLPTGDEAVQRELDGLAAVPRRIELVAGLVLDAHVVDLDLGAGGGLRAVADGDVVDDQFGGGRAALGAEFGLRHGCSSEVVSGYRVFRNRSGRGRRRCRGRRRTVGSGTSALSGNLITDDRPAADGTGGRGPREKPGSGLPMGRRDPGSGARHRRKPNALSDVPATRRAGGPEVISAGRAARSRARSRRCRSGAGG